MGQCVLGTQLLWNVTPCCAMQVKSPMPSLSISRGQLNGTGTSSGSSFSFGESMRPPKDANMVVLDDDGLSVVQEQLSSYIRTNCAMHFWVVLYPQRLVLMHVPGL